MSLPDKITTGLAGLDKILQQLRLGDNVVWQVATVEDYRHFVQPYIESALKDKKRLIYIRFAQHPPLTGDPRIKLCQLDAAIGFESFSKQIHEIITEGGEGAYYLFDCLSDLLDAWATDQMIGNFFLVTCPYLFKLDTIAYFAIRRNQHSFKTVARIRDTTQLLLDVYRVENEYYLHPLKVWNRYSPTMFLPHRQTGAEFFPLLNSVDASRLFTHMAESAQESSGRNLDYWDRLFLEAEGTNASGSAKEKSAMLDRLCRIVIGRETRMLELVKKTFSLDDLLLIKKRMIGTGFIGGKAVGMLLARKILANEGAAGDLEPHDSFFIGSDVFYSYIVENGWWEVWLSHKTEEGYFERAAELKEILLKGKFPEEIRESFRQMLEYFGQSPIIVRSSSLLEDSFGNAFAGKYESLFCVNQGEPDQRYKNYENSVRQVFASTMNEEALTYRLQRGLNRQDEQMALLIQRVSGAHYRRYFFPFLAGVGVSYNSFVWHESMEPQAGLVRLVFGLGTRAVNRVEGDYPRNIALDAPKLKPYAGLDDEIKYSQHEVDLLDLQRNELATVAFADLMVAEPGIKAQSVAVEDRLWRLNIDRFLDSSAFIRTMSIILKTLEKHYHYPVDIEFTVNLTAAGDLRINLVQCRPLQAKGETGRVEMPKSLAADKVLFSSKGNFMGGNLGQVIDRVIYVDPQAYSNLLYQKKFAIARLIGRLNRLSKGEGKVLLLGPGRWGTRDATLGVPVSFAEINNFAALGEIADPAAGFNPDLSFGSHFFLDLVEANIFYVALFAGRPGVVYNKNYLVPFDNRLAELEPDAQEFAGVVKVVDLPKPGLKLIADIKSQQVVCFAKPD